MIDKPEPRRFPPPWIAEETDACFIVRDASRQALAYVYFEEEPGRRSAAKLLTRDEARRIAANIAKLPEAVAQDLRASSLRLFDHLVAACHSAAGTVMPRPGLVRPAGLRESSAWAPPT